MQNLKNFISIRITQNKRGFSLFCSMTSITQIWFLAETKEYRDLNTSNLSLERCPSLLCHTLISFETQ